MPKSLQYYLRMHFVFCFANYFSESRIKEKIRLIESVAADPDITATMSIFVLDNSNSFSWGEPASILVDICKPMLNLGYLASVLYARNRYSAGGPSGCSDDDVFYILGNSDLDYLDSLPVFLKCVSQHGSLHGVYAPVIAEKALDGRLHAAVFKSQPQPKMSISHAFSTAIKAFVFRRPIAQKWPLLDNIPCSDYITNYIHGCFMCFSPSFVRSLPSTVPLFLYGEETLIQYLLSKYSATALVLRSCVMFHANEGPTSSMSRLRTSLLYFSQYLILRSVICG